MGCLSQIGPYLKIPDSESKKSENLHMVFLIVLTNTAIKIYNSISKVFKFIVAISILAVLFVKRDLANHIFKLFERNKKDKIEKEWKVEIKKFCDQNNLNISNTDLSLLNSYEYFLKLKFLNKLKKEKLFEFHKLLLEYKTSFDNQNSSDNYLIYKIIKNIFLSIFYNLISTKFLKNPYFKI